MAKGKGEVKGASQDSMIFEETTKIIKEVTSLQRRTMDFASDRTSVRRMLVHSILYALGALRASSTGEYDA